MLKNVPENLPETLYHAKFILISHGTQIDPVFNFTNLEAQKLWGIV